MSKAAARLALICALLGLGVSVGAAYVHYRLLFDPQYSSICDVTSTISCTQVYLSRFSTFGGIPVAVLGALWFVVAGLLSISGMTARPSVRESIPAYLFVLSTVALAVVLYLGYASFVVLKAVCLLCLATYAAVIGLFMVSGAATKVPMTTLPRRAMNDLRVFTGSPLAIAIAVLFLAGAGTTLALFPRETSAASATGSSPAATAPAAAPTESQRSEFERWYVAQPRITVSVPSEGAKVLILKFNDFQCPPCRQSHINYMPIIKKLQAEHPGAIRYVLIDYPLESECNVAVFGGGPHPAACEAAAAVRLARERGREEAMIDWVFANQEQLTPPLVRQAAKDTGQVPDFDAKYAATLELVKKDVALGQQVGIKSTPTFLINGVKVEGALPAQYFEQAIVYELQRATAR
ncbi:MAG: thioredoxin domain-containing protein [Acidobacteria bacterium]|nr:thioredoxin domain-containing protein [Acidobacteriota bacterium]